MSFIIDNPKKYMGSRVLFLTKCINDNNSKFLKKNKWYQVVKENNDTYTILFNSGGSLNYSKKRFVGKWNPNK